MGKVGGQNTSNFFFHNFPRSLGFSKPFEQVYIFQSHHRYNTLSFRTLKQIPPHPFPPTGWVPVWFGPKTSQRWASAGLVVPSAPECLGCSVLAICPRGGWHLSFGSGSGSHLSIQPGSDQRQAHVCPQGEITAGSKVAKMGGGCA